jgi:hypothetical protein
MYVVQGLIVPGFWRMSCSYMVSSSDWILVSLYFLRRRQTLAYVPTYYEVQLWFSWEMLRLRDTGCRHRGQKLTRHPLAAVGDRINNVRGRGDKQLE